MGVPIAGEEEIDVKCGKEIQAICTVLLGAGLTLGAAFAGAQQTAGEVNTGQDFTKPLTRLDLRLKYQEIEGGEFHNTVATARADVPFTLGGGWQLSLRVDVPYGWSNVPSSDNPDAEARNGLTDTLVQGLLIAPAGGRWAYGFGAQVIFPTASEDSMGAGKYQLVPSLGVKYDLGKWSRGAWCAALVRQAFDVASKDDDRPYVNQTYVQPIVNLMLPRLWFLTFAPEARYDWRTERWFVPFDLLVGKMVTANLVVSLEYKNAIVDDLPLYSQEVEARIGFLF